jgi:hypothetical protein
LPHFLLVLLIIQRFNLARWGFFTEFEGSPISVFTENNSGDKRILQATFEDNDTIYIYPSDNPVCNGVNLAGRSTGAAGARRKADHDPSALTSAKIKEGNDLIVKFSWPRSSRVSEVEFMEEARRFGESNGLVKNHIPTMHGRLDPPYAMCSTRPIREFLGLKVDGERVFWVIAFRRLE